MAHAVHPNYGSKHENNHRPAMNKGPVIKNNAGQRYASCAPTIFIMEVLASKYNIPIQKFCVRNDVPCGSTIGPILSGSLGIRTVDMGNPQLSMHSIREMCGVDDIAYCINLFKGFFLDFSTLDKSLTVD
jgi:aspartyl aminopeptidase